jgi:excisionase family DNA binding protein
MVFYTYARGPSMLKTNDGEGVPKKVVMSVPEAGEILGISRDAAYRAAKAGDIPTIRVGGLLKVPVIQFNRMLEGAA